MKLPSSDGQNTVIFLNIMYTCLHCFQWKENKKKSIFFIQKKKKKNFLTVKISLYINKYNVYAFFFKKKKNVTYNLKYFSLKN